MTRSALDLSSLRKALAQLEEALRFWREQSVESPLRRHLRAAVIQSFEFSYELSVRMLRRTLMERAAAADSVADLSFNDLMRKAADAGLLSDALRWRRWRDVRNATSHAYDEDRAEQVALGAGEFLDDACTLLRLLEQSLAA